MASDTLHFNEDGDYYIIGYANIVPCIVKIFKGFDQYSLPDENGNRVRLKKIKYQQRIYNFREIKLDNNFFEIPETKLVLNIAQFYALKDVKLKSNFIKIYYGYDPYKFFYRPVESLTLDRVYKISCDKIRVFLSKLEIEKFEKSFYCGPGKDDTFVIIQKIIFPSIPDQQFFLDFYSIFNIQFVDKDNEFLSRIYEDIGPGFYREARNYSAYSSQFKWKHLGKGSIEDIQDIINWYFF